MSSFHIIVVGVALVAAAWDVATRRIPNALTFGAALAALIVHAYVGGWSGAGMAAAGWAAGVALFFPVFALGGMGAGDVKLLGALGAWLGPVAAVWVALYSGIAGGVIGLLVAAFSGYLAQALHERLEPADVLAHRRPQTGAGADALDARGAPARVCGSGFRRTDGDHMASVKATTTQRLRSERGAELIEFALVLPLLMFIILGLVDFGFMFQRFEVVTNAAREGARIAVLPGYVDRRRGGPGPELPDHRRRRRHRPRTRRCRSRT